MISEHQLALHYPSLWHSVTPLSDGYWAIQNKLMQREITPPLNNASNKSMRGAINEVAFRAFSVLQSGQNKQIDRAIVQSTIESNAQRVIDYINRLNSGRTLSLDSFDAACVREATVLTFRHLYFFPQGSKVTLSPRFKGCGDVAECYGDAITNDCLYEIKAGDRNFRISDLRQLLIYSALAYANNDLGFSKIGLINPRTGHHWAKSLDQVCRAIAGQSMVDALQNLSDKFSDLNVLMHPN